MVSGDEFLQMFNASLGVFHFPLAQAERPWVDVHLQEFLFPERSSLISPLFKKAFGQCGDARALIAAAV